MDQLDDRIKRALSQAAEAPAPRLDNSFVGDIVDAFNTRMRWLFILAWVKGLGLFLGFLYCTWQFFLQDTTRGQVGYAAGAVTCILAVGLIDCIWMLLVQHNATRREIKRLELQIALLARHIEAGPEKVS